ncbi:hypothetical protein [Streptococcus pyogenes SSI-1]|nr:hypothetical protein [Streptococcus pyogenes SSI-1]
MAFRVFLNQLVCPSHDIKAVIPAITNQVPFTFPMGLIVWH